MRAGQRCVRCHMLSTRIAQIEDAKPACDVLRRSILECCFEDHKNDEIIIEAWLRNKTLQTLSTWIVSPTNAVYVAESVGEIVGVAMLSSGTTVALCYVSPDFVGRSVGKTLLQRLEQHAHALGTKELLLSSTQTGLAFYLRNGYVDKGASVSKFGLRSRMMSKIICNDVLPNAQFDCDTAYPST